MQATTPTVLIIDGEYHAQLYEMWLADSYTVRTASSRQSALSAIDETITVVFLRHELQSDLKLDVESKLKATVPAARIAVTTTQQTDVLFPDVSCAETLSQPITEAKLTALTDTLVNRTRYHEALRQYYRLTLQLTNRELTDADSQPDETELLEQRREQIAALLRTLQDRLDHVDRKTVVESLTTEMALPEQVSETADPSTKYRPNRCRDCGLSWGADHGGDLGEGYQSLGAYAWKCRRCGTVQHIAAPNNRSVARRRFS